MSSTTNKNINYNKYISAITDPISTKLEIITITTETTTITTKTKTTTNSTTKKTTTTTNLSYLLPESDQVEAWFLD